MQTKNGGGCIDKDANTYQVFVIISGDADKTAISYVIQVQNSQQFKKT